MAIRTVTWDGTDTSGHPAKIVSLTQRVRCTCGHMQTAIAKDAESLAASVAFFRANSCMECDWQERHKNDPPYDDDWD